MKLQDIFESQTKAKFIRAVKKAKAKKMNPKAKKTNQITFSGTRPSDVEASMGSTTGGSRYQASVSSVN